MSLHLPGQHRTWSSTDAPDPTRVPGVSRRCSAHLAWLISVRLPEGQPSVISRSIWSTNLPWQPRPSDCTDSSPVISTSGQKAEPVSRKSPRASSLPTCNHLKTFVHLWIIECGRYCQGGENENHHVLKLKVLGSQDAT